MLFRLTNAPTTFQAVINAVLNKYFKVFTLAYFNNILIYTNKILKEYIKYIKKVFIKLKKYKL